MKFIVIQNLTDDTRQFLAYSDIGGTFYVSCCNHPFDDEEAERHFESLPMQFDFPVMVIMVKYVDKNDVLSGFERLKANCLPATIALPADLNAW